MVEGGAQGTEEIGGGLLHGFSDFLWAMPKSRSYQVRVREAGRRNYRRKMAAVWRLICVVDTVAPNKSHE